MKISDDKVEAGAYELYVCISEFYGDPIADRVPPEIKKDFREWTKRIIGAMEKVK